MVVDDHDAVIGSENTSPSLDSAEAAPLWPPAPENAIGLLYDRQRALSKNFVRNAQTGTVEKVDYPLVGFFTAIQEQTVSNIYELAKLLGELSKSTHHAIIYGRPVGGLSKQHARRRLHPRKGEPATIEPVARRWVAVDFDKIACPPSIDPVHDVDEIVDHVVGLLPDEFASVSCWWQLTSSAGMDPDGQIHARLWFWLSRPLVEWELKAWLAGSPVDASVFRPAQPIYIAAPTFDGMTDPVPRRCGLLRGHSDSVDVPVIEKPAPRPPALSSATGAGSTSSGYEAHRADIGDHAGGRGFHAPIGSAIGAYFWRGSDADVVWLRADLEAAIRAADDSRHSPDYIEKKVLDLDSRIEWTRTQEARRENEALLHRPTGRPNRPLVTLKLAEGRLKLREALAAFSAKFERHRSVTAAPGAVLDGNLAAIGFSEAPRLLINATPGIGKSYNTIQLTGQTILDGREVGERRVVWYAVADHNIAGERLAEFNEAWPDIGAIAFGGRLSPDRADARRTLCARPEVARAVGDCELSPGKTICEGCPNLTYEGPKACRYFGQVEVDTQVIFLPYNYIWTLGVTKRFGSVPDLIVIDEDIAAAAVASRQIGLGDVDKGLLGDAKDFLGRIAPILRRLADETRAGFGAVVPLAALVDAGITVEMAIRAARVLRYPDEVQLPKTTIVNDREQEIIDTAYAAMPAAVRLRGQHWAAELVVQAFDAGQPTVPGLVVARTRTKNHAEHISARMMRMQEVTRELNGVPVLCLSATAKLKLIERVFGGCRFDHVNLDVEAPNARGLFVLANVSDKKLAPDKDDRDDDRETARRLRRRYYDYVKFRCFQFRIIGSSRQNVVWFMTKKLAALALEEFTDRPSNLAIADHGSLGVGSNRFKHFDLLIDFAGMRIVPDEVALQVEAQTRRSVPRLGYQPDGRPIWPPAVDVAIPIAGQPEGPLIKAARYEHSGSEGYRFAKYEELKLQIASRLRLVNRTPHDVAYFETWGNGAVPLEYVAFCDDPKKNMPNIAQLVGIAGIALSEGRGFAQWAYRLLHQRWATVDAAGIAHKRESQTDKTLGKKSLPGEAVALSFLQGICRFEIWPRFVIKFEGDRTVTDTVGIDFETLLAEPWHKDSSAAARAIIAEARRAHLAGEPASAIATAARARLAKLTGIDVARFELSELPIDETGERLAELTPLGGDIPTRESSAAFIIGALSFFHLLDLHAEVEGGELTLAPDATLPTLPTWWAQPLPASNAPPTGRRFDASYRAAAGLVRVRFFPDASAGGVWTDTWFNPIDPPPHDVRAKIVAEVASMDAG